VGHRWGRRFVTSTQTPLPLALVLELVLAPVLGVVPVPDSQ
jgi:hypothetical protein